MLNQQERHAGDFFAIFPLDPAMVAPADFFLNECRRRVMLLLRVSADRCPGPSCNARLDLNCRLAGKGASLGACMDASLP